MPNIVTITLNTAIGNKGREHIIFAKRDRKLNEARTNRKLLRQKKREEEHSKTDISLTVM